MSELAEHIKTQIRDGGPMGLDRYMLECLAHPTHGYYMTAEPFGVSGDFTTAPEVSQMFGELIALWLAEQWLLMGQPQNTRLVEIGPGRGTLMADALRALSSIPTMMEQTSVHLVETSPRLKEVQAETLRNHIGIQWHDHINDVPDGPMLLVANELFDALPIRQFVKTDNGWAERHVGLSDDGAFEWQDIACPAPPHMAAPEAKVGDTIEVSPASSALMADISRRIKFQGGAGLIIDYGYYELATADTLQAVKDHDFSNPLEHQGASDLTAHVNFVALKNIAETTGIHVFGPVAQGLFLTGLGIGARANQLITSSPAKADDVLTAKERLVSFEQMGKLFKVMGLATDVRQASGFGARP